MLLRVNMTLQDKIKEAHAKAANLYLQRQTIEMNLQQLHIEKQKIEMAMMKSDGEIETLEKLLQEQMLNKDEDKPILKRLTNG